MFSWIMALWNWSPVAIIALYFVIGYLITGIMFRFNDQISQLLPGKNIPLVNPNPSVSDFVYGLFFWWFFAATILVLIICFQLYKLILFGARGFRPLPSADKKEKGVPLSH